MTLAEAIIAENLEVVKELLINDPNLINEPYEDKELSYLAARVGNLEIFKYIVEYSRASFNLLDSEGRTVLFSAVTTNNLELVKYIVERLGFSGLDGDYNLITPYDEAIRANANLIVDYFRDLYGDISDMYRNPIRTGMHPDPSIVRVGEDYYMVNSSFIFFPCIPISHSKDLIHWEVIGHAITNPDWADINELEGGRGYWAPDISYHNGRFYITATYRLNDVPPTYRKQMVVSSDKPEGPYCKPSFIDEDGIDPSIFTDDDGKRYMLLNRGARLFPISEDGTTQLGPATLLYYGSNKRAPEGSHLLKKDGYYYLFQAEGGTGEGHMITVARSRELFGVYEPCPFNPIMRQTNPNAAIKRCGHGKPVSTPDDEWYIPYLCGRQIDGNYSLLGRETALDKITWTADGWPMVNNLKGPSTLAKKPVTNTKSESLNTPSNTMSLINNGSLSKNYSWVRVPETDAYQISDSLFKLKSSKESLSTMNARNILVTPQDAFHFEYNAKIVVPEVTSVSETNVLAKDNGQAGITCYYDENTYLTYHLENSDGKLSLKVFEHIDEEDIEYTIIPDVTSDLHLRIVTDYLKRDFYYSVDGKEYILAHTLNNVYYLCDEGIKKGKRFTGATVGIYAYHPSDSYGFFETVRYVK